MDNINSHEQMEASLLSLIINSGNNDIFLDTFDKVEINDFINPFHRKVYGLLIELVVKESLRIDKTILTSKFKSKEQIKSYNDIVSIPASFDNLSYYVSEVKNNAKLRTLKDVLTVAITKLGDQEEVNAMEIAGIIEDKLLEVITTNKFDFMTPKDLLPTVLEKMKSNVMNDSGVTTSIPGLDAITDGLPIGYIIIAARPSIGKTEVGLQMCIHNSLTGHRSAIFSLEMSELQLMHRLIAQVAKVQGHKIKNGTLNSDDMQKIEHALPVIESMPIHIDTDCAGLSATQLLAKAKRLKIKHPDLSLIMIDYIQLMAGGDGERNAEVTSISRTIKTMSSVLKVPVLALSQLSRGVENREDKRPRLSDLRDSGSLEQDADIVMFLYSDAYYDNAMRDNPVTDLEIIVSKNRNGPVGSVLTRNNKPFQLIEEV